MDLNVKHPTCLIEAGKMSKRVYFILSGTVHIMNKEGLYEYGTLSEGSYFGDISILTRQPNNYSYFFNSKGEKHLFLLSLDNLAFISICDNFKYSKEILLQRAIKKSQIFETYKMVTLLKYMKILQKDNLNLKFKKGPLFKMLLF